MRRSEAIWRGPPGRSITDVSFNLVTRMLRMTFSDGTTQDAGPLPVGEGGAVAISSDAGNILEIREDGVFAPSNLTTANW